ncbi:MAG TPA: hypothetical protein VGZ28_13565 [Terriglobales bacterium]|jgi:hypothetical protein|nr:hypothetical protein [Terriglobales bacterium]
MLRVIYRWLLCLHPPYFRRRFARELLSIFDQQKGTLASAKMAADGVLSLLRQWALRPQFWEEPVAPAPAGVPLFYMTTSFRPRAWPLIDGVLLSLATFAAVCMMMQYTWNHPVYMPIVSYYHSSSHHLPQPPGSLTAPVRLSPPIYIDQGRVFLMISTPSRRPQPKPH